MSSEALARIVRVAEILAADAKDPIMAARALEIVALARIVQKEIGA